MNICVLVWSVYEIDPRVRSYAESFAENGNMVDIICLSPDYRSSLPIKYRRNGVTVYEIGKRKNDLRISGYLLSLFKFFLKSCYYCTKLSLKTSYDVVHVHSIPDFEVFAAIIPKLNNAKVILDIHDPMPDLFAAKYGKKQSSLNIRSLKLVERISSKFADHVITVTDHWRKEIGKRSFIPKDKISAIVNYANTQYFNDSNIQNPKGDDKYFSILYPGTLNKHCGIDVALKAVDMVRKKIPIRFDIYGNGSEYSKLLKTVETLEMNDIVFFHNYIPWEKIPQLMSRYDVGLALLSGKGEYSKHALNSKIFEFLAMGIPVIVTRTKSTEHYLNDRLTMFSKINDPKDVANCIMQLYWQTDKRKMFSENGIKYSKNTNWAIQIARFFPIIEKMVDRKHTFSSLSKSH